MMYYWRKLSEKQREEIMEYRRTQRFPKHSPPHFSFAGSGRYLITAACYEHRSIIGASNDRMSECEAAVLKVCEANCSDIYSWCFLPNHYHILVRTDAMKSLRAGLGRFHGSSSFRWNGEDDARGRQVWHNCFDRKITSAGHYFAALNYVLNNAVHHGYVSKWQDWPWSNAKSYLDDVGSEEAKQVWQEYPVLDFGKKWDTF